MTMNEGALSTFAINLEGVGSKACLLVIFLAAEQPVLLEWALDGDTPCLSAHESLESLMAAIANCRDLTHTFAHNADQEVRNPKASHWVKMKVLAGLSSF